MRLYCFSLDLSNVIFAFISFDLMKIIKIFQTCVDQAKISNAEWLQKLMVWLIKEIQIIMFNANNFTQVAQHIIISRGFLGSSVVKNTAANAGDVSSDLGWGRFPGEGNGNPLQYSCLGNLMERGALWDTVHRVAKHPSNTVLPLTTTINLL